jgi:hypothetical protein
VGHQSRLKRERKQTLAGARAALRALSDPALLAMWEQFCGHLGGNKALDALIMDEVIRRDGIVVPKGQNVGVSEVGA